MPDISMCQDGECPSRIRCYRYTAKPSAYQWYADFERKPEADKCPTGFYPVVPDLIKGEWS